MLIDFTPEEIKSMRAIVLAAPFSAFGESHTFTQKSRIRIVLKLHAALEGISSDCYEDED